MNNPYPDLDPPEPEWTDEDWAAVEARAYTPEAIRRRHGWGGQTYVDAAVERLADEVANLKRRLSRCDR